MIFETNGLKAPYFHGGETQARSTRGVKLIVNLHHPHQEVPTPPRGHVPIFLYINRLLLQQVQAPHEVLFTYDYFHGNRRALLMSTPVMTRARSTPAHLCSNVAWHAGSLVLIGFMYGRGAGTRSRITIGT